MNDMGSFITSIISKSMRRLLPQYRRRRCSYLSYSTSQQRFHKGYLYSRARSDRGFIICLYKPFLPLPGQAIPATLLSCSRPQRHSQCPWTATRYSSTKTPEERLNKILDPKYAPVHTHRRSTPVIVDGEFITFDNIFLRDACQCAECVDPSTLQKLFQTASISKDIRALKATSKLDGSVEIIWAIDGTDYSHKSIYTPQQLRIFSSLRHRIRSRYNDQSYILWDGKLMEQEVQFLNYNDYMTNDQVLLFALIQLVRYGLVFLKNVPECPSLDQTVTPAVESIAERIGPIKTTFYGKTWEIKNIAKDPKNIAMTSLNLGLHMDLLYFTSPPTLQFLHCIKNSARGGSTYFADSFRAAEWIRMNSPNNFQSLLTFPVTFHYKNDGHHYHSIHPTVALEQHTYRQRKRIAHVNYSPPFQAPFEIEIGCPPSPSFRQFYSAMKLFTGLVDDPVNQFELRLNPGECVIFHNRRTLHGRREFDPTSGDRRLQGAYVDGDAFLSKFRILSSNYVREKIEPDEDFEYIR